MTQKDLSEKLNVSRATVGRYETDERFPDKDTLKNIADIFDVSIDYLLKRTDNKTIDTISSNSSVDKCLEDIAYKKTYDDIIDILISEDLMDEKNYIPEEILQDIVEYGIGAAIKIAKIKKSNLKE